MLIKESPSIILFGDSFNYQLSILNYPLKFSKNFHMMANEELKHAAMMRDMANKEMSHVKDEHKDAIFADEYQRYFGEKFVDKHAKVKQILAEIGS